MAERTGELCFTRLQSQTKLRKTRFNSQDRLVSLLGTITNILGRIPVRNIYLFFFMCTSFGIDAEILF